MTPPTITSIIPRPAAPITVRLARADDLPFIDHLQKMHSKQVGFLSRQIIESNIAQGHVLIAEAPAPGEDPSPQPSPTGGEGAGLTDSRINGLTTPGTPVGYCIGTDRYFKHDDVGIIYQLNVAPGKQRGLVGAMLIKALFERAAYGCRLFCCWCAQDIEANHFWEALGFVPLAFRAGSAQKGRVHIFWQKRIAAGDTTTPWWFPSKTAGGSLREDRIVLPIPPGTHWSDAKPLILPGVPGDSGDEPKQLPGAGGTPGVQRARLDPSGGSDQGKFIREVKNPLHAETARRPPDEPRPPIPGAGAMRRNGLMFDIPQPGAALPESKAGKAAKPKPRRVKARCDPRLVAAARELKDRWLEKVNADPTVLESAPGGGKYDVSRALPEARSAPAMIATPTALLEAA